MRKLLLAHGSALSNLALFVAVDTGLFERQGLQVEAPPLAHFSSTAALLRGGGAELGTTGFTQALVDHDRPDPLRIVGGSGKLGMALVGRPGLSMNELRGQRAGTFADDPMEVLLHDALRMHGMDPTQIERILYPSLAGAVADLMSGRLAALTLIEPWISRLRLRGFEVLCDGLQAWGDDYPDTLLVARKSFLDAHPEIVRAALRAMLDAQEAITKNPRSALSASAYRYPEFTLDELLAGIAAQPPIIDIRPLRECILARARSLEALGRMRVSGSIGEIFSFDLLEQTLAQSPAETFTSSSAVQPL
ncbi:ABC transporter substrate-binding protein [Paraburkholderia silvatlantica]|uniref:ABC-type nitrate/sulfonate/bicarbonate transport system substrate-binding protein n=1 Tax=Paraburkholderia silvatlantica TaxID=321895 RepID=A0ABR6FKR0_9BURK|nr:ABC transporter substrate-binding protein [Paraburkholderia silvatlantica]MBB2927941.1 ABC-type nitrate/sulfonate/bicarbonate transport system substrate-binding protein [Paraburkholderia silvatlantica]PVY27496.1 ABC-type nitrate/sulfonate/bicarbonate transport system substrate-binding protein [Paraburkholderia silvatlantica]PXW34469.1 ABC-type nitrate/sulfonate/bicarbonate transport system substrate-binding protein [Paraburkholderia silvatlantica]